MEQIYVILNKIQNRYGVYIGRKDLRRLAIFLSGYEVAISEIIGKTVFFDYKMQRFIEEKYNICSCAMHWDDIILLNRTEAEAFDLFFEHLEEFKEVEQNYAVQLEYDVRNPVITTKI